MRCLHQFVIQPGSFVVALQKGAKLRGITVVDGTQPPWNLPCTPYLNLEVDVEAPIVKRCFLTVMADSELPDHLDKLDFVGSFTLGGFTGFVYDVGEMSTEGKEAGTG